MTTQYISHGVNCAGSEVRRALYEAKIGKRIVMNELTVFHVSDCPYSELFTSGWWRAVVGGARRGLIRAVTYDRRFGRISNMMIA